VLVEASGPSHPDDVWARYTTPDTWPSWARHLRDVRTDVTQIQPGARGTVLGPRGMSVDFTITDVDHDLRTWAWSVGRGPIAVRLEHHVLPTAAGGSRATMRALGVAAAPLHPYRLLASAALRNLVTQESSGPQAGRPTEAVATFPFAFAPSYAAAARPFGISPRTTGVEVGPAWLHVRYGRWRLLTPRSNITGATVTGDFSFAKTAGPPHLSFGDRGVSFTTNGDRALCLTFREPVIVLDPTGTVRHPGATLAVAHPEGLAAALDLPL
jgi:hypothetical protein